jgi:hypothetical protein
LCAGGGEELPFVVVWFDRCISSNTDLSKPDEGGTKSSSLNLHWVMISCYENCKEFVLKETSLSSSIEMSSSNLVRF